MAKTLKDLVTAARAQIEEISAEQFQQIQNADTEYLLIDVREAAEYAAGHIAGARSIPRGILELCADREYPKRHEELSNARQQPVIVYCASGGGLRWRRPYCNKWDSNTCNRWPAAWLDGKSWTSTSRSRSPARFAIGGAITATRYRAYCRGSAVVYLSCSMAKLELTS